ncbi:ABC transporter ATP-binding protein, partial [Neobacillus piezotolerans]
MLKGLFNKLFTSTETKTDQPKSISHREVEALVEAKIKEHAATLEKNSSPNLLADQEDYSLTEKQIEFALSLLSKIKEYTLAMDPTNLTLKDLNKLIAYNRFKNKGILVNLEKKG